MKDLENFLIDENASLKDALVKIKNNKSRHVFVTLKETQKIIGVISEGEGHHPDISFGWGYAKISITTHAIEGLSENDFILAAKIDDKINDGNV